MLKKSFFLSIIALGISFSLFAQNQYGKNIKPTKNVILMIPDGCSLSVYSAARWYNFYNDNQNDKLAIDPYVCGIVKTHNSNAPIGDSAPTTSTYMTGYLSQAGNIAIYPLADEKQDIFPIDKSKSLQPLTTVLEAAKYDLKKSTGLVATVEFPHATPADCSAHYYDRSNYGILAPQQVANKIDVMIAGGNSILTPELEKELKAQGTQVMRDDIASFRAYNGENKLWALFNERELPFEIDRDEKVTPSLAEMTEKAIQGLSKNPNGFFLMVEGSQIDWAAHANDAATIITEYIAFDKAVQVAIDFAKSNGETTVIVLSDHGNSGFSIGRNNLKNYAGASLDKLFGNISKVNVSTRKLEELLTNADPKDFKAIIKEWANIDITEEDLNNLLSTKDFKEGDYMKKASSKNIGAVLASIMQKNHYFGFTTGGHTGEDVLLAVYHPEGDTPNGMNTNIDINKYLCDVVGLERPLDEITDEIYAKHQDVFKGLKYSVDTKSSTPTLVVKKGKKELVVPAFGSKAFLNKKEIDLNSVVVYIDKIDTFFLPKNLVDYLK